MAQTPKAEYSFNKTTAFIALSLPTTTDYKIEKKDDQLIIAFNEPIAHIFDDVVNSLQGLASSKSISDDKKSVAIELLLPVEIKNYIKNKKLVIELNLPHQASDDTFNAPGKTQPVVIESAQRIRNSFSVSTAQISTPTEPIIASLSFPWNIPVGLAVFQRGKYLWIVFDHPQKVDVAELQKTAGSLASEIFQFPHPVATIIRMTPQPGLKTMIRKEGLLWVIDMTKGDIPNMLKDMLIFTQYDSLKRPYLFFPTTTAGNIVPTIDPEVGDFILVAPTADVGVGFNTSYKYPEFELLKSQQGLAILNQAPDIMINRGNTGLILKASNRGLNITPDLDIQKRQQMLRRSGDNKKFNIYLPPNLLAQNYNEAINQLNQEIIKASPEDKNKATLELVKYYISKGLGTNALAILNKLQKNKAPEVNSEIFHALTGVANFLSRRYDEAMKEFEYGELPNINEAIFWRTLASSAKEFKKENNAILFSFITLIRDYPQELRDRIAIIGAETALKSGDDISAQNFIDVLKSSSDSLINRTAHADYLFAQKLDIQGYPLNALKEYRRISKANSMKYSSLARYESAILGQKLNLTPSKEAIAELEKLRFAWNEPEFKLQLLNTLANSYIKNKDYYNALNTVNATIPLTEEKGHPAIKNKMMNWFEDVFVNNQADDMSAFKSLALYQDYKWLAPSSPYYNEIVTKLADRLVAVDLLDRAQEILTTQLKQKNLSHEERGKIGTRMALIYLFEQNSPQALEILDTTQYSDLSESLQGHRRVIRARALANADQVPQALELLKDDYSRNAILFKSELFWNSRMWNEASETIPYLIDKPTPGKPLSSEQIGYILDWATTLKKAGKEAVLVRVRNKFLPYFEKSKYHSAFSVLTNHLETDKIDLKAINQAVEDIAAFSNFAKIYNDSLKLTDIK